MIWGFIILVFAFNIYFISQKGTFLQWMQLLYLLIAYAIARLFYLGLSEQWALWIPYPGYTLSSKFIYYPDSVLDIMDQAYNRAVSFVLLLIGCWIVKKVIFYWLGPLKFKAKKTTTNKVFALFVGSVTAWYTLFFVFALFSLIGIPFVQNALNQPCVEFILRRTPFLTKSVFELWFHNLAQVHL